MSWYSDREKFDEHDDERCAIFCPDGAKGSCKNCVYIHPELIEKEEDDE